MTSRPGYFHRKQRVPRFHRLLQQSRLMAVLLLALQGLALAGCGSASSSGTVIAPVHTPPLPSTPAPFVLSLPPHGLRAADVPPVVATVDGRPVPTWLYLSQVNFRLAVQENLLSPGQQVVPVNQAQAAAIENSALQAVITDMLLVSYGESHGLAPTAQQAAAEYKRVVQRRGGLARSLQQVAREYLTVAQDQIVARNALVTRALLDRFVAGLHQPVQTVSYRMIVTSSQDQAGKVRAQLATTFDWTDLAARYSLDPLGRAQGGEQPLLARGQGDVTLQHAVFSAPALQLSPPVHLPSGWAVIQVLHRLPTMTIYSEDLQRYHAWVQRLRATAAITSYIPLNWKN